MEFQFKEDRDKENLVATYSDEDLMSALGIPITNGRFTSPFREDNRPGCILVKAPNGRLRYMDWAEFDKPMDVFDICMLYYDMTFADAIEHLWKLMEGSSSNILVASRLGRETIRVAKASDIKVEPRQWLDSDIEWWKKFGIDRSILKHFNVEAVLCMYVNGVKKYHYQYILPGMKPAYVYHLGDTLKVYFPLHLDFRFRTNGGKAIQGWDQLPERGTFLVITKSLKDVMCLYRHGILAIAPQSEGQIFPDKVLEQLKNRFTFIVVLFDNDRAGIEGLHKWKDKGFTVSFIPRDWKVKDISDFYKRYGHKKTDQIIAKAKEFYLW